MAHMQTCTTHPPAACQSHQGAVGRFAPTPSGPLHVGNLYAMMLTWLAAHYRNGYVVMRIEDEDTAAKLLHANGFVGMND